MLARSGDTFATSLADLDGELCGVGNDEQLFALQSISKADSVNIGENTETFEAESPEVSLRSWGQRLGSGLAWTSAHQARAAPTAMNAIGAVTSARSRRFENSPDANSAAVATTMAVTPMAIALLVDQR